MAVARSKTVVPGQPGFFHCYTRCVRRSFLCGFDRETGVSYEHRRQWLVDRIHEVTQLFAVDVYAYAIMHNHYHIVLYVDPQRVEDWTDEEVADRWHKVYAWRRKKSNQDRKKTTPTEEQLSKWRERLGSLSWIMRTINEPIARWANGDGDVTGHFWEGRFSSLPILDEIGVITCMSYVDLNPIRGGIALDLDSSDFTSIQARLEDLKSSVSSETKDEFEQEPLGPLLSESKQKLTFSIKINQYIELVNSTALDIIGEKMLSKDVLSKYGIAIANWVYVVKRLQTLFRTAIGNTSSFEKFKIDTGRTRHRDLQGRAHLYG